MTLLPDKRTIFAAKIQLELTDLLKIKFQHSYMKHPETFGVFERPHFVFKSFLKPIIYGNWKTSWRHVDFEKFIDNTSPH